MHHQPVLMVLTQFLVYLITRKNDLTVQVIKLVVYCHPNSHTHMGEVFCSTTQWQYTSAGPGVRTTNTPSTGLPALPSKLLLPPLSFYAFVKNINQLLIFISCYK